MSRWFAPRREPGAHRAPQFFDDEFAAWLRRERDSWVNPATADGKAIHHFLTGLLNKYRAHLEAGVPLDQEVPASFWEQPYGPDALMDMPISDDARIPGHTLGECPVSGGDCGMLHEPDDATIPIRISRTTSRGVLIPPPSTAAPSPTR